MPTVGMGAFIAPAIPIVQVSREDVFKVRVRQVLGAMAAQYPSLLCKAQFVRPLVLLDGNEFPGDKGTEKWASIAEDVEAYNIEKEERWYEASVGVIRSRINYLLIPIGYDVHVNDEVLLNGETWLVVEAPQALGVQKLKLDKTKSRFNKPGRFDPRYRIFGSKAAIS